MEIIKKNSPYLHRKDSLARMLSDVLIALAPTVVMAIVVYGLAAVRNLAISIAAMCLAEFVFVLIAHRLPYDGKKHSFKERWKVATSKYTVNNFLAPCISAVIFALIMPAQTSPGYMIYVALLVGALSGIIIGKLVFGGTGSNIFNPAALGMVFAKFCYGSKYVYPTNFYVDHISTGGTALTAVSQTTSAGVSSFVGQFAGINEYSVLDMVLGRIPGVLGETFKIAILLGAVYLLIRRAADWRIMASYFGTYAFLTALAGIVVVNKLPGLSYLQFLGFSLFTGGVCFGGVFMFTDPVTSPIHSPGRVMFGIIGASLTAIIRIFGALPEGVAYSILLCNMLAPVLDSPSWSSQHYTKKKIMVMGGLILLPALIIVLTLLFSPGAAA